MQSTSITTLYQSAGGFVWVGTEAGLLRYDGENMLRLLRPDSPADDHVSSIYRDEQGRMWIGYHDGAIFHYDPFSHLQAFRYTGDSLTAPVVGFAEDRSGHLWIATYGAGLYLLRQGRLSRAVRVADPAGSDIYALAADSRGRIWTGSDAGLTMYRLSADSIHYQQLGRSEGLPDEIVRVILPDEAGNCWVGTHDRGFGYINGETAEVMFWTPDWQQGVINSLAWSSPDELWIGTENRGLWRYYIQQEVLSSIATPPLPSDRIKVLHRDEEGIMWIQSGAGHLWSANLLFEFLDDGPTQVQSLLADKRGRMWVGTQMGLYIRSAQAGDSAATVKVLDGNFLSLYEDQRGTIWAGTFGDGVILLDPLSLAHRQLSERDGLSNGSIFSIDGYQDRVWLATLGGITEIRLPPDGKPLQIHNYRRQDGLGANFIYKVMVDSRQRVWFGTDGEGVIMLENGQLRQLAFDDSSSVGSIYSIAEDKSGDIWLGTAQSGIFRCRDDRCKQIIDQPDLRQPNIAGIVADRQGCMLMIYPAGIQVLDPADGSRRYYDQESGIEKWEPNLNAYYSAEDGRIWIGTQQGIIQYAGYLPIGRTRPQVHLTGLSINLQSVDTAHAHRLTYQRNNVVFDYVGLWFTDPGSVRYRYRLRGLDQNWIQSRDRSAVYSQLPPGNYTFELSAAHQDKYFPPSQFSYTFTVVPPLWRRPWFVALLLLAGLAILYLLIRNREYRLERQALLRREKLAAQFELLKSQINPHFLFNNFNTLVALIEEDPKVAVDYVERLSDFYRSILQYREQSAIRLDEELSLLRNYFFLLKQRFAESLHFEIKDAESDGYILPLTLQLLVENAIKHNIVSRDRPLAITVEIQDGYVSVRHPLQRKMSAEPSTGFGLQSVIDRYAALTDLAVMIEAGPEAFIVRIPLLSQKIITRRS